MRVISGSARGKKLKSPKTDLIRPTMDRVKESLFNILGRKVYGCRFLDLFSGSGAIGIEALSRGAELVLFADRDTRLLQENLSLCSFDKNRYIMIESDRNLWMKKIKEREAVFDIIFMDPPYGLPNIEELCLDLDRNGLLAEEGTLIVETDLRQSLSPGISTLRRSDERVYSITRLSFYERANKSE